MVSTLRAERNLLHDWREYWRERPEMAGKRLCRALVHVRGPDVVARHGGEQDRVEAVQGAAVGAEQGA